MVRRTIVGSPYIRAIPQIRCRRAGPAASRASVLKYRSQRRPRPAYVFGAMLPNSGREVRRVESSHEPLH